jgi:uncharacterized membrane protein required for colicin V production
MLTQFFLSINWVDVALAVAFARIVFVSVKTGFIAELCRVLGTIIAVFVTLHWYSWVATAIGKKISLSPHILQLITFILLWAIILLIMRFVRIGLMMLFKVETTHKGFDQYAAGVLSVGRGLLVCSLIIYAIFLTHHKALTGMAHKSWSNQIVGRAAVKTYGFLHNHVIGKIFPASQYNNAIEEIGRLKS